MQVQNQIQTQDLETELMRHIVSQVKEKILGRSYVDEKDLRRLAELLMFGSKEVRGLDKILEKFKEGWQVEDFDVCYVGCHWGNEIEVMVRLPNKWSEEIKIKTRTCDEMTKEEYQRYLEMIEKLKAEFEEKRRTREIEKEKRRLEERLKEVKEDLDRYKEYYKYEHERAKKLEQQLEEFREFIIMKEIESEFIEWLAEKRYKQGLEQLKEKIKEEFFPNEYDDC